MGPGFFKGGFDLPALNEKAQHLLGGQRPIGTKKGLGRKALLWIFDQQPADGHRRQAGMIPHRRIRAAVDGAGADGIPSLYRHRLPDRSRIVQAGLKGG